MSLGTLLLRRHRQRPPGSSEFTIQDLGTVSGTQPINASGKSEVVYTATLAGATTFTLSGLTTLGQAVQLRIKQPAGGGVSTALPAANWPNGMVGVTTNQANAVDRFFFQQVGDTALTGLTLGNDLR